MQRVDFLTVVGTADQNFKVTLVNMREEFDVLHWLDTLYLRAFEFPFTDKQETHVALLQFIHTHFYEAWDNIMRGRVAGMLNSTRSAIDAALTFYQIHEDPKTEARYWAGDNHFKFIKGNLKTAYTKRGEFKYASLLFKLHETCSEVGGHCDVEAMKRRVFKDGDTIYANHSQIAGNPFEHRVWFYFVITAFAHILWIVGLVVTKMEGGEEWKREVGEVIRLATERTEAMTPANVDG